MNEIDMYGVDWGLVKKHMELNQEDETACPDGHMIDLNELLAISGNYYECCDPIEIICDETCRHGHKSKPFQED